jgi:predicted RNase H-like HicB family nuclease
MRRYVVVLTPEPDGSAYTVTVPALPGCITWGATVDGALAMSRDAIKTFLDGEPVTEWPVPADVVAAEVDTYMVEHDGRLGRVQGGILQATA